MARGGFSSLTLKRNKSWTAAAEWAWAECVCFWGVGYIEQTTGTNQKLREAKQQLGSCRRQGAFPTHSKQARTSTYIPPPHPARHHTHRTPTNHHDGERRQRGGRAGARGGGGGETFAADARCNPVFAPVFHAVPHCKLWLWLSPCLHVVVVVGGKERGGRGKVFERRCSHSHPPTPAFPVVSSLSPFPSQNLRYSSPTRP